MTQSATTADPTAADNTAFKVIAALGFCHLLNDMMQSLLTAIYPILKTDFGLDFGQIGLLTLTFNVTASLFQPLVGLYTDKRPQPYSLSVGMGFTLVGLILLAVAHHYWLLLISAALVGLGSAVFHPEASRVARMASGGRHGLAQSLFQVGGNVGSAIGPLLAAFIVLQKGQASIAWFSIAALVAMLVLWQVGNWYSRHRVAAAGRSVAVPALALSTRKVVLALTVLGVLVFSKYVYMASLTSYYTFYLIEKFDVSVRDSQLLLFLFLGAVAVGTIVGGPIGDRFGRKLVIWGSILGALPFTLALPYAGGLAWTAVLTVLIGLIMASAFSAIIVFAQELVPGKVGLIAGLFFGFAFGIGGIGAAVLGAVADVRGIEYVYWICSLLPLVGLLTVFLPDMEAARAKGAQVQAA
ncbi:MFS transporter [Phreatobacter stygius]|uniref:MFS transporter n=1 Tax=Phreatobacter stygius TaxID=1940610 RepID=UPI0024829A4B|nr:MFS transporter [Phreatobacter stygius]